MQVCIAALALALGWWTLRRFDAIVLERQQRRAKERADREAWLDSPSGLPGLTVRERLRRVNELAAAAFAPRRRLRSASHPDAAGAISSSYE